MTTGNVLIVDDDTDFVELYKELLTGEGHSVSVAGTPEQAVSELEANGAAIDVVLIDQKLHGPGGPDSGLELVARARQLSPFAKPIIVTGYSSPDAIARAFTEGVYDYLVKNGAFEALLKAKVRNAVEITKERRLSALSVDARERRIRSLWSSCEAETDKNKKGAELEELVSLLFRSTPVFATVTSRLRTASEEIDITVLNQAVSAPWTSEGPYILCECKNWSSNVGASEFRDFAGKINTKHKRSTVGLFISLHGFTEGFRSAKAESPGDAVILLLDRAAVQRWIDASDRLAFLTDVHQQQTVGR